MRAGGAVLVGPGPHLMAGLCAVELVITEGGGGNRQSSTGEHAGRQLVACQFSCSGAEDKNSRSETVQQVSARAATHHSHMPNGETGYSDGIFTDKGLKGVWVTTFCGTGYQQHTVCITIFSMVMDG